MIGEVTIGRVVGLIAIAFALMGTGYAVSNAAFRHSTIVVAGIIVVMLGVLGCACLLGLAPDNEGKEMETQRSFNPSSD